MKYSYHLRNKETGETAVYEEGYDWDSEQSMLFQWLENNYSCDCNRSLFMYGWDEDRELGCNLGENTIVLDRVVREDGTEVELPGSQE
jgi:hypothetical protein